ncbi:MAG: uncharacterized protein JWQ72_589 [Polaromonas sp.]|nr:uncharacterized protein [Polaromonas sp.]
MAYIVDTTKFQAEGAYLRWQLVARRLGMLDAAGNRLMPSVLQLRWTLKPELGLPTEPFIVWRRHRKLSEPKPIQAETSSSGLFGQGAMVDLRGTYTHIGLNVSGGPGVVYGFVGSPWLTSIVAIAAVPAGASQTVALTAPAIEGLLVSSSLGINSITGVRADDLSAAAGWEKFERVGLPVQKSDWAGQGIGDHGTDQGMFSALTDAESAALQRLERGAPPIGWAALIEPGLPAPAWSAPAAPVVLKELQLGLLDDLRGIAGLPPAGQGAIKIGKALPPPENSSGDQMSGPGTTSQVSPIGMTYMAAGTDCFNCLGLGFGTAYAVIAGPDDQGSALDYDYMVTARYEKGLSGADSALDYAAIVPSPQQAIGTPPPAAMAQQMMGNLRPFVTDGSWRASVRLSWDKPVPIPLFRPRSFALACSGVAPASPATLIMNKRSDGAPLPIAINYASGPTDPEPNRLSAVEREIPVPNDPGTRTLKYAAAQQDIYGQWSKWVAIDAMLTQPGVDDVRIVSGEFKFISVPVPPLARCTANLVLEFLWDWRIRSSLAISLRGRLYPATYHGEPPPDQTLPGGLQTRLGGTLVTTFTLRFDVLTGSGAPTSSWPGYIAGTHCIALNPAGDAQVAFGAAQGDEARRYRVTIPGFELDFGPPGHIGLALWAQGQEAIAPQKVGSWSAEPSMIATSDPRPPLIVPDIVALSSLPDAAGESHAVLSWSGSAGADGYFIYESTETKLLQAAGEAEPDPDKTLSQRLTRLRQIFDAQPARMRSEFTRRNSRLIKTSSADVTLPRGSTVIHLYVVLGVSAGQVEAQWPAASTSLYAFAVPRVPKPAAPMIEATSILDKNVTPPVFRAQLIITTRKGPRVRRLHLHRVRVDDAAKELDIMGPPLLTVEPTTPDWSIAQTSDTLGMHIVSASGTDTPAGSWKRVWYRVAAWSDADLLRGTLGARSPASTAAWVVIPPPTPPDLSAIAIEWPGGALADVLLKWSSAAPVPKTPVGHHMLSIRARRVGAAPEEPALLAFEGPLSQLPLVKPVTGQAAWRDAASAKPVQYLAFIRRATINDALEVSVRITDPVGRSSESLAMVKAGPLLPDPVLTNQSIAMNAPPPGAQFNWSSSTPIDPGVYTLRVTIARPPRRLGPRLIPLPPISLQMALSDVPLDEPGPVPPGVDSLRLRRLPGPGPDFAYYAFVRIAFTQITVRLSAPDGRVAQIVQLPG